MPDTVCKPVYSRGSVGNSVSPTVRGAAIDVPNKYYLNPPKIVNSATGHGKRFLDLLCFRIHAASYIFLIFFVFFSNLLSLVQWGNKRGMSNWGQY